MDTQFDIIELAQQNFLKLHEGVSIEQLNKIPEGFKNNLVWNYAHVVASLQMLCYARTNLPLSLNEPFVHAYKIGTKPEKFITQEEYNTFKIYADKGFAQLKTDYNNVYFKDFKGFTTSTGINISNIELCINYVAFHHGMHLGYSMAIKKLVVN